MNVTELARQLRINTKDLLEILPQYGFDVGKKAIKIDDKVAEQITRKWKYIKKQIEDKKLGEMEEKKKKNSKNKAFLTKEIKKLSKKVSFFLEKFSKIRDNSLPLF